LAALCRFAWKAWNTDFQRRSGHIAGTSMDGARGRRRCRDHQLRDPVSRRKRGRLEAGDRRQSTEERAHADQTQDERRSPVQSGRSQQGRHRTVLRPERTGSHQRSRRSVSVHSYFDIWDFSHL